MELRRYIQWRTLIVPLVLLALAATACGGASDAGSSGGEAEDRDGPTIVIGSFNFPESVMLAEIYAQVLEDDGYTVRREFDLGARELILPELEDGDLSLLPEYLGSALAVGFGGDATSDEEETLERLRERFDEIGVEVLEPAPGQNTNVFAVTQDYAEEHGLETISDLGDVDGTVTFSGPPECEDRSTCYGGLRDVYGLDDVEFEVMPEASARISSLDQGRVDVTLLFSTMPVIEERGFVVLEDDRGIVPVENVVPVVDRDVLEAYGSDLEDLIDSVSERITTDVLMELNRRVEVDAEDPRDVARQWLEEEDLVG